MKLKNKGWGYEKWIVNKKEYCGKLLYFVKGKKCSLHFHKLKDETFYLQSGKLLISYCDRNEWEGVGLIATNDVEKKKSSLETKILEPGDNFYVYRFLVHQMEALENSELFEFSTEHFEEDSYRLIKGD